MSSFGVQNISSGSDQFFSQLQKFIVDNGIIGTTAGVAIALATNELIKSLASDVIVPAIIILCLRLNVKWLTAFFPGKTELDLTNFSKQIIGWVLVVVITFFFIKTTFEGLLGASKPVEKEEKKKEAFFSF